MCRLSANLTLLFGVVFYLTAVAGLLSAVSCGGPPPRSVNLHDLADISRLPPELSLRDLQNGEAPGEEAVDEQASDDTPEGALAAQRSGVTSLFPLVVELTTEAVYPGMLEARWDRRTLDTLEVPAARRVHQLVLPRELLVRPKHGLRVGVWAQADDGGQQVGRAHLSGARAFWGPPRGAEAATEEVLLFEGEQLSVFLPASRRQWLSVKARSCARPARLEARVASDLGDRQNVRVATIRQAAHEYWLDWSWPANGPDRQRLSLSVSGDSALVSLGRIGWEPSVENVSCAVYRVTRAAAAKPPVVVILLDAMRADRWGARRGGQSLTPTLDGFAERGVLFDRARCQVPYTMGSLPVVMTGRYPSKDTGYPGERPQPSLASLLRTRGYASVAISANGWLRPGTVPAMGFDVVLDIHSWLRANRTEAPPYWAIHMIEPLREMLFLLGDQPFLIFLHVMQPHGPYSPPAPYDTLYVPPDGGRIKGLEPFIPDRIPPPVRRSPSPSEVAYLRGRYDGNVASVDQAVAGITETLQRYGPERNPVLVILSDHGEALLEHGNVAHASDLYEENLLVPLCLSGPGLPRGVLVEDPVELVDLAPTLLALTGCSPLESMDGESLLPIIWGRGGRERRSFVSMCPRQGRLAVYQPPWKYIRTGDSREELFHLEQDPLELSNVARAHPHLCATLRAICATWRERDVPPVMPPEDSLTEEERSRLEILGYIVP